ncbi:MAG: ABC transporter permease subunit [Dehalococcoidia bacterium]|jgi:ABC-2 type transport system permease protein|nr:ABC transporter permease subunit [Dehalococcoidia bacterium]MDP7509880.1 ABC transporter permease subunit [Dehalococcoidia bacterium]
MTQSSGELFDLGYQHYQGPREGRMRARKAVFANGFRTTLGLGRGSLAKVLPILLFAAVMAPAVIIALVVSQLEPLADSVPDHSNYYQIVSTILILFSAIIAPELLCPDRRNGVISLYLARPLTATDYVAGRWLAFFSITLLLVYSGQIVLFIGLVLSAVEPWDYLRDNWLDIPRFLGAGLVVAAFITTIPLAVASFTNRRAYAAAFVIGFFIISHAAGNILTACEENGELRRDVPAEAQCEPLTGDAAKWFSLVAMFAVPMHVSDMIFGVEDEEGDSDRVAELPSIVPIGWYLLLTAGPGYALWWRYRRISA